MWVFCLCTLHYVPFFKAHIACITTMPFAVGDAMALPRINLTLTPVCLGFGLTSLTSYVSLWLTVKGVIFALSVNMCSGSDVYMTHYTDEQYVHRCERKSSFMHKLIIRLKCLEVADCYKLRQSFALPRTERKKVIFPPFSWQGKLGSALSLSLSPSMEYARIS